MKVPGLVALPHFLREESTVTDELEWEFRQVFAEVVGSSIAVRPQVFCFERLIARIVATFLLGELDQLAHRSLKLLLFGDAVLEELEQP